MAKWGMSFPVGRLPSMPAMGFRREPYCIAEARRVASEEGIELVGETTVRRIETGDPSQESFQVEWERAE